jgi:protein-tyrosine phosphatase
MALRERTLAWDGCVNVRDLGGHPTEDGAETRFGAVVRADSVRTLSDAGWRGLVDYGIATIVDLRFHSELDADPPATLPVDVVHVPLFPEPGSADWDAIDAVANAATDRVDTVRAVYLEVLERRPRAFAAAVAAVADAPSGGVVVHCAAGKDRTGLVSALLLRLAGVGVAEIGADYAESERNLAPLWQSWIEEGEDEPERERRRQLTATPAAVMTGVIDELERRYGDVRAYLRAGGAIDDSLDRVLARLRG